MISPEVTNYVWFDEMNNYTPRGESQVGVFEIKETSVNTQSPKQN
jgi:uncharacterized protein YifE (UPF0438 family)